MIGCLTETTTCVVAKPLFHIIRIKEVLSIGSPEIFKKYLHFIVQNTGVSDWNDEDICLSYIFEHFDGLIFKAMKTIWESN